MYRMNAVRVLPIGILASGRLLCETKEGHGATSAPRQSQRCVRDESSEAVACGARPHVFPEAAGGATASFRPRLHLCAETWRSATASFRTKYVSCECKGPQHESLDRVTGNYENRLKFNATPEKVFEYFASTVDKHGAPAMSPLDFMHSIVPHTFKPEYVVLPEEVYSKVLMLADIDGDGLISFAEYLLFTTLITLTTRDLEIAFDIFSDKRDAMTYRNFCDMMVAVMKRSSRGGKYRPSTILDPRGVSTPLTIEQMVEQSSLATHFFGDKPETSKKTVRCRAVAELFARLRDDVLFFEFMRHSTGGGTIRDNNRAKMTIAAEQMGTLMAGFVNPNHIETVATRVHAKDWSNVADITFAEVRVFESVTNDLDKLSAAVEFMALKGIKLDRAGLAALIDNLASPHDNVQVKALVEIIVRVFDVDGDGVLSEDEFVQVLKNRRNRSASVQWPLFHRIRDMFM